MGFFLLLLEDSCLTNSQTSAPSALSPSGANTHISHSPDHPEGVTWNGTKQATPAAAPGAPSPGQWLQRGVVAGMGLGPRSLLPE